MIKIAITGPESSGKTTLSKLLAEHYGITYIPEYAREYLAHTNGKYSQSDLIKIANGHHKWILDSKQSELNKEFLIVDTDFVVIGVWSKYKYGLIDPEVQELIQSNIFDLHILCEPDIPWEYDILRENPDNRYELFSMYKQILNTYKKNYISVNGSIEKRLKKAIEAIELI